MSSNDGTRPTDAHESLLAHHFFPASLKLVDVPRRKFLGRMLLVNQANDHGEIIVSGFADSVAHDAKDRIEVRLERRYRHRRRAVEFLTRAAPGLPAAQWRITWFLGANDARKSDRRRASGIPREPAYIDSTFVLMCTIGRFLGLSALFSPARRRHGVAMDAGLAPSLARARRDPCRGGGALIAARATAKAT
jgi:hypothetical protein